MAVGAMHAKLLAIQVFLCHATLVAVTPMAMAPVIMRPRIPIIASARAPKATRGILTEVYYPGF